MFKRLSALSASILTFALLVVSCGQYYSEGTIEVNSPDGKIKFSFELKEMPEPHPAGENMYYRVSHNGNELLKDSPLGFYFGDDGIVLGNMVIMGLSESSGTDQFEAPFSKQSSVRAEYNQTVISLREKDIPAKTFDLIVRAYNDGVAFRFHFPEQEPKIKIPSAKHSGFMKEFILTDEFTGYNFPLDVEALALFIPVLPPHNYERNYTRLKVSEFTRDSTTALPVLMLYPHGSAMCIAEAGLTPDYTASFLSGARNIDDALATVLVPLPGEKQNKVLGEVPFTTPWRVLMIADHPGKLIESNLILALNEPCKIDDISWIKPGKASWDWWSGRVVGKRRGRVQVGEFETSTYEHYIDFAAENGLEYFLVDAGWYGDHQNPEADITTPAPEIDMEHLVRYADSVGVRLILWVNWECVDKQIDQAFPLYEQWGIAGVKVDYMNRDDQEMIAYYHKVVEKAAQHKLLVDFHGAYRPTGIRRTWPNLITREGVVGLEYLKWSTWADPEHNVTIPYTRMLLGPMDFTPGGFNNATQRSFTSRDVDPMTLGTRCHQLAMFVVFESPLQCLADSPISYSREKGLDFLSLVPTVWDQTRFIEGEVGDYIVLARKNGDKWYLGAMTDWDERELEIPLDFLGSGSWKAKAWADGARAATRPEEVDISEGEVNASELLPVKLAPGGGFVAVFEPAN